MSIGRAIGVLVASWVFSLILRYILSLRPSKNIEAIRETLSAGKLVVTLREWPRSEPSASREVHRMNNERAEIVYLKTQKPNGTIVETVLCETKEGEKLSITFRNAEVTAWTENGRGLSSKRSDQENLLARRILYDIRAAAGVSVAIHL